MRFWAALASRSRRRDDIRGGRRVATRYFGAGPSSSGIFRHPLRRMVSYVEEVEDKRVDSVMWRWCVAFCALLQPDMATDDR